MDSGLKRDVISVLEGVIQSFSKYDPDSIMELSDHITHSASIYQDEDTLLVAIIVYSIGKIIAKGKIRRYPQDAWNDFVTNVKYNLDCSLKAIKSNNHVLFHKCLTDIQKSIIMLESTFMTYIDYVVDNAKIKKGTKMYEHGISLGRIAKLFGVSEWELMSYAGKTSILERDKKPSDVKERLIRVRRFFE